MGGAGEGIGGGGKGDQSPWTFKKWKKWKKDIKNNILKFRRKKEELFVLSVTLYILTRINIFHFFFYLNPRPFSPYVVFQSTKFAWTVRLDEDVYSSFYMCSSVFRTIQHLCVTFHREKKWGRFKSTY